MRIRDSLLAAVLSLLAVACASPPPEGLPGAGAPDASIAEEDAGIVEQPDGGADAGTIDLSVDPDGGSPENPPPATATPAPTMAEGDPCAATAQFVRGTHYRTILSAGGLRWYAVYVPESYTPSPKMLVLNFHGYTSDPVQQMLLSQMNEEAEARGFLVAYPAGVNRAWNAGKCCGDPAWVTKIDDVQFVRDVIDAIGRELCVDPKRVFSTGMSNGGFLSHRLACELSDRIAAIAPVAGVRGIPSCNPPRKVPVQHYHGTEDALVPYHGGGTMGFLSAPATHAEWKLRNGCFGFDDETYDHGDARCMRGKGCGDGADTELCTITGGGHTWPGGTPVPILGHTTQDIDATSRMVDFFEAHPMP